MAIAIADLCAALQFLIVVVLDAERAADVVDHVLIGSRVVAARQFVAGGFGGFPVRVDVASGQRRTGARDLRQLVLEFGAAALFGLAEAAFLGAAFALGAAFFAAARFAGLAAFFGATFLAALRAAFFEGFFADFFAAALLAGFFLAVFAGFLRAMTHESFPGWFPGAPPERGFP